MRDLNFTLCIRLVLFSLFAFILNSCATQSTYPINNPSQNNQPEPQRYVDYSSRVPQHISTGEKTILIDPNTHAFGAYDANGNLVRAGLATSGGNWCPDIGRPCHTRSGSFRIQSLGGPGCKSTLYPLHKGGAPMPYCMFFNGNQGLHGSPYTVDANASHGCVRIHVDDAEWVRYNFANIGTKVIVEPY